MADDMKLQIILEGVNDATPAFDAISKSFEGLQTLADDLSKALAKFLDPLMEDARAVSTAFEEPSKQASEQLSKIAEGLKPIDEEATAIAKGVFSDFDRASKDSEEALKVIAEGLKGTETAAAEASNTIIKDFEEAAKKSEDALANVGKGMNHGSSNHGGGLFGMQGQMDTMYAGMALGGVAAPLDLGIKDAIKSYGDFSQAVANVNSMMGLTPPEVKKISDQLVELSRTAPAGPTELANALYGIVGAGVPAADAMDVLKTSAEAATAGQTDVSTATSALISVMDSYGLKGKDVAKIADQMFAANAAGAMTFDQFAKSIGTVAGPAAQAGVSFGEVASATAALTNQGISAQRATEGLRALMMGIMAPTHGAQQEAHKLGIEWDQNALKQKGLAGMMQEAMKATGGNSQELKKLIPNIAAWTVAVDLGGKGAASYKQAMDTMSQSAGATGRALQAQEQGFTEQMNHMHNSIQSAQIAFVSGLAPALTLIADKIRDLAQWFQSLSPNTREFLSIAVALTAAVTTLGAGFMLFLSGVGGIVTGFNAIRDAFIGISVAEGIMDALNPVGWIVLAGAAVIALAAAIITYWTPIKNFVVKLWDDIKSGTETAWNAMSTWLSTTWNSIVSSAKNIWNSLVTGIQNLWNGFKTWITTTTQNIANDIVKGFEWLYNHNYYFKDLVDFIKKSWETIKQDATSIWNEIKGLLSSTWQGIVTAANTVWNPIKTFFSGLWNDISGTASSMWNGITSTLSGLWKGSVHDAETIWNGLGSFFSSLGNDAYQWGSNLIHMIGQGIDNAIQEVAGAAEGVAKKIWQFLGFHSPSKDGPGSDSDQWAPNFVNMFVDGLNNGVPQIKDAAHNLANGLYRFLGFHSPTEEGPANDADQWAPNFIAMLSQGLLDGVPKVKDAATQVAQAIKDAIDQMIQQISDDMKKISDVSKTTATDMQTAFTSAFDTIAQKAQSTLQQVQQAVQQMQQSIQNAQLSAPGVSGGGGGGMDNADVGTSGVTQNPDGSYTYDPSQDTSFQSAIQGSSIPAFGGGGRVDKPTLALVGEAGTEWIIPDDFFKSQNGFTMGLSSMPIMAGAGGRSGFGGGTPIINNYITVQGHVIRESELTNIVSRGQWNKMKLQDRF